MSLKLVPFKSLGAVSYLPSMTVSVAVCEIFSVKEWRDLEKYVKPGDTCVCDRTVIIFIICWCTENDLKVYQKPPCGVPKLHCKICGVPNWTSGVPNWTCTEVVYSVVPKWICTELDLPRHIYVLLTSSIVNINYCLSNY